MWGNAIHGAAVGQSVRQEISGVVVIENDRGRVEVDERLMINELTAVTKHVLGAMCIGLRIF